MSESEISGISLGSDHPPVESDEIVLQVDDKIFRTTKGTLMEESAYFSSRLANRRVAVDRKLTLDMDPTVFTHVLRYLRHGVLPCFYDKTHGFDYNLYSLVLAQAEYLLIERLSSWIRDKRYEKAVTKERSAKTYLDEVGDINGSDTADTECEYRFVWGKKEVYVCPRGITVHCRPSDCGRQCNNARGDIPVYHEEDELRIFEIKTKTVFNRQICLENLSGSTHNLERG